MATTAPPLSLCAITPTVLLAYGASNWFLAQRYNRITAKHRAKTLERAAQTDTKEIQLTIKRTTNDHP